MLEMFEVLADTTCNINIDPIVPKTISSVIDILKIAVPILLIIFGMLDLAKAVMSNDEKEMKGAQGKLIKRCIYAVAIFFVVALVQFIFGRLAAADSGDKNIDEANVSACISCFINGKNCYGTGNNDGSVTKND